MPGAFGGAFEPGESDARELLPGALADLLSIDGERPAPIAGLVSIRGGVTELRYRGDLRGLAPLERGAQPDVLRALAAVAQALAALHATKRVHGDLRPGHVWTSPGKTLLSYIEKPLDAGALLRARLRQGADPREVAFAAPEVVAGEPATYGSDVFSLGALLYWAVTGRVPHGRVTLPARTGLSTPLEQLILLALEPEATGRPRLADLLSELEKVAPAPSPALPHSVGEGEGQGGRAPLVFQVRKVSPPAEKPTEKPDEKQVAKQEAPRPEFETVPALQEAARDRKSSPVVLTVLLALGSIFVLTGALWLVAAGWNTIGEWGRLALLGVLTAGIAAAGHGLEARGNARSGLALIVLASQLLWAIGADLLAITGSSARAGPWALVAACVAGVGYALAVRRQSAVLAVLASIGALMALVFTWNALDALGHCVLLSVATIGLALSAFALDRRGHGAAPAVHFLWTQLLWLDGGFYLGAVNRIDESGPWAIVASTAAMGSFWLAVRRRSILFSTFGTLAASVGLILTGVAFSTGSPEGGALWTLVCALVLFALGVALRATTGESVGAPPAFVAALFAILSACLGLGLTKRLPEFSVEFPYLVGALALVAAFALKRSAGFSGGALSVATLVLVLAPVVHAGLETPASHSLRTEAVTLGAALLVLGIFLRGSAALRASIFLVAIAHVSVGRSSGLTASAIALPLVAAAFQGRHEGVAALAALAVAAACVLWGGILEHRSLEDSLVRGPRFWAEWTLLAALLESSLALVGRGRAVGAPFGAVSALFVVASFVAALASYEQALVFSASWPYLLGALSVGAAVACTRLQLEHARTTCLALAAIVLAGTPLFHGFRVGPTLEAYRVGAPLAGVLVLVASFVLLRRPAQATALVAASIAGVAHVAASRSPAATVGALAFALLGHGVLRRSGTLGSLGSLGAAVAMVSWGYELGLTGPTAVAEWAAVSAVLLAAVALAARVLDGHLADPATRQGEPVGAPAAVMAALLLLASWFLGLGMLPEKERLGDFWPYLLLALLLGVAFAARSGPYRAIALVPAAVIACITPTLHALWHFSEPSYLYVATIVGTGAVVAGFKWPALSANQGSQLTAILVGLASIAIAPTTLALIRLGDKNGDALFLELLDPALGPAERLEHRLFYLPYLVLTSVVLVALALLFAKDSPRKLPYRILEVSGLAIFFGTLSLLSFVRWNEFLYPSVLAGGGVLALAVGAWGRHVLLVFVPAIALTIQLWFQYWAKLKDKAPMPLLVIGFGIGLLVGAMLFEKRVRPKLKELEEWA